MTCEVIDLFRFYDFRGGGDRLRDSSFSNSRFGGSGTTGSRSHGGYVVGDGSIDASVSMIMVLWMLVLVIAYYMRRDYLLRLPLRWE